MNEFYQLLQNGIPPASPVTVGASVSPGFPAKNKRLDGKSEKGKGSHLSLFQYKTPV
jgi:hypothetical protein